MLGCGTGRILAGFAAFAALTAVLPALGATGRLECANGLTLVLSTGSDAGDCMSEKDGRALCADGASDAAYARCDRGCLFTNGAGSCSLADEESVPASLVLVCEDGSRYLLRTRTGTGACTTSDDKGARAAHCADGKTNDASADCRRGCLAPRGKALCAKYKSVAEKTPDPVPQGHADQK